MIVVMKVVGNYTRGLFLLVALLAIVACGIKTDSAIVSSSTDTGTGTGTGASTGTAVETVPAAPTGVSATAGDAQVTISWAPVTGATSYNVYYNTVSGMATGGTKITNAASPYTCTGLLNGRLYFLIVTAVNAAGESGVSGQVSAMPQVSAPAAPPSGVAVTPGIAQVSISWSTVAGATSYNIYYGTTAGITTAGTRITTTASGTAITGLSNNTPYYFAVTAVNAGGESALSSEVSATLTLGAPAGVIATAGDAQITVSWAAVTGAASYNVYYGAAAGVTTAGTKITGVTSPYTRTGLTNGVAYYFVVTAVNAGGESAVSAEASATPQIPAPTGVGATVQSTQITVSWAAVTGAVSYNIYYGTSPGVTTAGTKIAGVISPYYRTGFTNGVTYYLVVTAVGAGGESAVSSEVSFTPGRTVTTIAGTAGIVGSLDGTGSAALFYWPTGITTDGTNLYVADTYNHTIRQVVIATGVVTTIAGSAGVTGATDGAGAAALFWAPRDLTINGANLYVTDTWNHTIRQVVVATGVVTTIAGGAGKKGSVNGTGAAARFGFPAGITTDGTNLYVTDSNSIIRQVAIATGVVTTIAGGAGITGATDGTGTAARFNNPEGVATDGTNLYVADEQNSTIRKVALATGVVTTIAGVALSPGSTDGAGTVAQFNSPTGITSDGTNLYVADNQNSVIRKVVIATGAVTTFAGAALVAGSIDGTGPLARFKYPTGITSDGTNLYVTDTSNSIIRKIQ